MIISIRCSSQLRRLPTRNSRYTGIQRGESTSAGWRSRCRCLYPQWGRYTGGIQPGTTSPANARMGGICSMMLMLLLTELARLDVQLSAGPDGLHVQAPAGALADELRQARTEHKAALLR